MSDTTGHGFGCEIDSDLRSQKSLLKNYFIDFVWGIVIYNQVKHTKW